MQLMTHLDLLHYFRQQKIIFFFTFSRYYAKTHSVAMLVAFNTQQKVAIMEFVDVLTICYHLIFHMLAPMFYYLTPSNGYIYRAILSDMDRSKVL